MHHRLLAIALLSAFAACAPAPSSGSGAPRTCKNDLDCGTHRYCSAGRVCASDCIDDADCIGPSKEAQCNVHGRCVTPPDGGIADGAGP